MAVKRWTALVLAVALCLGLWGCARGFAVSQKGLSRQPLTTYESIGTPAAAYYPDNRMARNALDMEIHDGRLYVGCGDYDKNTGPTPVLSCDLKSLGQWQKEASLPDEQIGRFVTVGGRLTIPGMDPEGRPKTGTYYQLAKDCWQVRNGLPHNLHHFDMVQYRGALFAALGAQPGGSSLAISRDGGKTYKQVRLMKKGKPVDTATYGLVRSYNLYQVDGGLYADLWWVQEDTKTWSYEIYRYEKGNFVYISDLRKSIKGGQNGYTVPPLWTKETFKDTLFLSAGYLYTTKDMQTFTPVALRENARTYDLYRYGKRLYILTATPKQEGDNTVYTVEIYSIANPKRGIYRTEARFDYPVIPTALAVDKDHFFIATGDWHTENEKNGTILCMNRK